MSFSNLGTAWNYEEFYEYIDSIRLQLAWANSITVHHTGAPNLAQRPKGLTKQHIRNIASFYQRKNWSRGPHLFTDDTDTRSALGMSPFTERGIHAKSFNRSSIGIEMLGEYDYTDDPFSGRGAKVLANTAMYVRILLDAMGLPTNEKTIKFHRDDPKTRKQCPGMKFTKQHFIELVKNAMWPMPSTTPPITETPFTVVSPSEPISALPAIMVGMRKEKWFAENKAAIKHAIDAANAMIEGAKKLTLTDFHVVANAELLLVDGVVSNSGRHPGGHGECGCLPLPSNMRFWTGHDIDPTVRRSAYENVKWFCAYLVGLKNSGPYAELFEPRRTEIANAYVLAAIVHGYGYANNYTRKDKQREIPSATYAIAEVAASQQSSAMARTLKHYGFKHSEKLIYNRYANLADGARIHSTAT